MELSPRKRFRAFIAGFKYEILLLALFQHLFIGIVLRDLHNYTRSVWPVTVIILVIASTGVFYGKGRIKNILRVVLGIVVIEFPILLTYYGYPAILMHAVSISYFLFFIYIFYEVLVFLIRPSYINRDIIVAAACGYFLLIEIYVFFLQFLYYGNPASTFMDFVYLSTITITSVGYGDITPALYYSKLSLAILGIAGHFYTVVLMGILIGKFSNANK